MNEKKIVLGIPTLNRADLLKECLDDLSQNLSDLERYIIVDNGNQNIEIPLNLKEKVIVYTPEKNLGVAASWNFIMKTGFEYLNADYVMFLNDDIVLGYNSQQILEILNRCPNYYLIVGGYYWSSFFISQEGYEAVGKFDENFYPAYFEDNDYNRRLSLINGDGIKRSFYVKEFVPKIKRNSMTIKRDPTINKNFEDNKKYYVKKWGGFPRQEKFKTPFNK